MSKSAINSFICFAYSFKYNKYLFLANVDFFSFKSLLISFLQYKQLLNSISLWKLSPFVIHVFTSFMFILFPSNIPLRTIDEEMEEMENIIECVSFVNQYMVPQNYNTLIPPVVFRDNAIMQQQISA